MHRLVEWVYMHTVCVVACVDERFSQYNIINFSH